MVRFLHTIQLVCGDWYILVKVDNPSREAPVRCIEVSKKERKKETPIKKEAEVKETKSRRRQKERRRQKPRRRKKSRRRQ